MDPAIMTSASGNAELLRLHYLRSMGINSYYPRFRLPGALPSQLVSLAQTQPAAPIAPSVVPAQAQTPEIAASAPQIETRMPLEEAGRSAPTRRPVRAAANVAEEQGAALQFQLLLLAVDTDLALLCLIPALARPQLQDRQARLLHNLLRWLGRPLPADCTPRRYQWPLPGMSLHNDAQQAAASLGHFVQQAALEQPFRHLLLLGGQLAEQLGSTAFVPATCQLTIIPGLDEMLALPQQKREAWQALLPLHAALQARQS